MIILPFALLWLWYYITLWIHWICIPMFLTVASLALCDCLSACQVIMKEVGQVTKVRLSYYLALLSNDSKTRYQDRRTFVTSSALDKSRKTKPQRNRTKHKQCAYFLGCILCMWHFREWNQFWNYWHWWLIWNVYWWKVYLNEIEGKYISYMLQSKIHWKTGVVLMPTLLRLVAPHNNDLQCHQWQ